jgi:hypothetical protein
MVWANRDMLGTIAGVFFLLPELVKTLLPMPHLLPAMSFEQMSDTITVFYADKPGLVALLVLLTLPALVGYLTLLAMLLDRDRPTVGAAIGLALGLLPSFFAALVLIALSLFVMLVAVLSILALAMPPAIAALVALAAMVYPLTRVVLIAPEMVTRRLRNPIRAIAGGLSATRGQFAGLLLYFVPAVAVFVVVCGLVMIFVSPLLAHVAQEDAQRLIGQAIGAVLSAVGYTYFAAIVASTYDQLGPIATARGTISPSSPS